MSWFFYAFLSAILVSFAAITNKKVLFREHAMEFAATLACVNALLSAPLFFFVDFKSLEIVPVAILFGISVMGAIAFLLVTKAMRHMEVSLISPLRMISPGVTAFAAFIFLGERLDFYQIVGIVFLVLGLLILETRDLRESGGFRALKPSKYTLLVFAAIGIYAMTAVLDRYILSRHEFSPIAYIPLVHLFLAFHFLVFLSVFHDGIGGVRHGIKTSGWWIFLAALFTVGYRLAEIKAVSMVSVGLAVAVKDMAPIFTILIAGELFHEKNIARKIFATIIMVIGIVFIVT